MQSDAPSRGQNVGLYIGGALVVIALATFGTLTYLRRSGAVASERSDREKVVEAGIPVLVATASSNSGPRVVTLPGDVRAFRQVTLYAKVSGYLKQIRVDKGDHVSDGQVLGVVESPETDQQVLSVQADLAVKKQLAGRYRALVKTGVVSQQEMDNAEAGLEASTAELARVNALKDYEIIRAPFAGQITTRYVDPGALLPAATGSTQAAQPLVDIADMNTLRIFVYVGQADAPYVADGDEVILTGADDASSLNITAKISRITRNLDPRTRTMLAEIDLDNRQGLLYPGIFVHAHLRVKTPSGLLIPADAVVIKGGKHQVAVIEAGHAHFHDVQVGDDDGHLVRILAGLKDGDVVGLHVGDEVSEGAAVQPMSLKQ